MIEEEENKNLGIEEDIVISEVEVEMEMDEAGDNIITDDNNQEEEDNVVEAESPNLMAKREIAEAAAAASLTASKSRERFDDETQDLQEQIQELELEEADKAAILAGSLLERPKSRASSFRSERGGRASSPVVIVPTSVKGKKQVELTGGGGGKSPGLVGSLLHNLSGFGGFLWNAITGPTDILSDHESNVDLPAARNNKKKSMSVVTASGDDSEDTISVASSEAPFSHNRYATTITRPGSVGSGARRDSFGGMRMIAEPGREREILKEGDEAVKLIGRDFDDKEFDILGEEIVSKIQQGIPPRWRLSTTWKLVYSTRGNGFSLSTLYNSCKNLKSPVIIAVKDDAETVFGAFATHPLQPRNGHYGTGECFLWRWDSQDHCIVKYPSTGKNNYFLMGEADYMAVGCGAGKFGLWLDAELFQGQSHPVPTFDNECLSGGGEEFECVGVEIWALLD